MVIPLQRNEPVVFFDGTAAIQALFIRMRGRDAEIKVTQSQVSVYPPNEVVIVPAENLTVDFDTVGADDASLNYNE